MLHGIKSRRKNFTAMMMRRMLPKLRAVAGLLPARATRRLRGPTMGLRPKRLGSHLAFLSSFSSFASLSSFSSSPSCRPSPSSAAGTRPLDESRSAQNSRSRAVGTQ